MITLGHLGLLVITLEITCDHIGSLGITCDRVWSLGVTCDHMPQRGAVVLLYTSSKANAAVLL